MGSDDQVELLNNEKNDPALFCILLEKIRDEEIQLPDAAINEWMNHFIVLGSEETIQKLFATQAIQIKNDWLLKAEECKQEGILCLFLSEGANPFGLPMHETIFRKRSYNNLDQGLNLLNNFAHFSGVWDAIERQYKTDDNLYPLSYYYALTGTDDYPINPEVFNYIFFEGDKVSFDTAYEQSAPKLSSTLNQWKQYPQICLPSIASPGTPEDLAAFSFRQKAFLRLHSEALAYFSGQLSLIVDDLKILNKKLLKEWAAMHPGVPFPELRIDKDYTLVRKYNYYSTIPEADEGQVQLTKFNRMLRKILLRDLKAAGLFGSSSANEMELSYLKFIGFAPIAIADEQITRSGLLFSEGYLAPTGHTHYAHMIQWWILTQALSQNKLKLTYSGEVFTVQEFFAEIFNPIYKNCYDGMGLWSMLFDNYRFNTIADGIASKRFTLLSFNTPTDVMSIIREHHDNPELKALAHYIISTDLKRMQRLKSLDMNEGYIFGDLAGPLFSARFEAVAVEVNKRMESLSEGTTIEAQGTGYMILKKTIFDLRAKAERAGHRSATVIPESEVAQEARSESYCSIL